MPIRSSVQKLAAGLDVAVADLVLSQSGSYQVTFVVLAVLMALTVIDTVRLPDDAGAHVSGAAH
jgi:hypothetical protein